MATNKGKTGTKNTQTSGYTPSKSVVKVVDPKTGKPYMYDKQYDAIFDTNGNQLDSDDFRHIREVMSTGKDIAYSKLIAKKKQELKDNGITSEFAEVYRAGDSEKALRLLNRTFNYYDGTGIGNFEDKEIFDLVKLLAKRDNVASSTTYKEPPLLWSLGMPAKKKDELSDYGAWGISEYRPSRGSENYPYYFTPIADIENPSEKRKQTISSMLRKGLKKYAQNTTVDSKGKIHSEFENKSIPLMDEDWVGNMGTFGFSVNSKDSSFVSFHDLWNLDPNASHNKPRFLPKAVYRKILTSAGVPENEQEAMITGLLRGDSATEILGFSPKGFKKGVPVYDRIYKDPTSGKTIKEMLKENTYAYGGKVKKYANGGKLPIDMYGRSVRKYEGGGRTPINIAPIESLPAGTIQNPAYQEYLAKINNEGIAKVAQSPGLLSTKSSNTTGDVVGAIGSIAGGYLSAEGTKQVDKGNMAVGRAGQFAGAAAPILTNPALVAASGGMSVAIGMPAAAFAGLVTGAIQQPAWNRKEKAANIEEGMAMYQGLNQQNNYMQDPIRYAAYGGKINHYGDGTLSITYDQEGGHISPVEIVGQKIHKAISANIFADILEAVNAPKKGKTKNMEQTFKDVLYAYDNPTFLDPRNPFYGDKNYINTNRWAPQHAAYGGKVPGGELAQVESGETFSYGGVLHPVKTKSKHEDLPKNLANQFLPDNSTVYSSKPIKNIEKILPIAKSFGLNTDLTAVKLYAGGVKNGDTVASLSEKGFKKLNPAKDLGNQFYTKANLRNTKYFEENLTALGELVNPETYRKISNSEYEQGQQGIQQILHAAYGGKVNQYAYGNYEDGPYRMQSPVMIPDILAPSTEARWAETQNLPVELVPDFDRTAWDNRPVNGVYEEWKGVPYTHPGSNADPFADSGMGPQQEWKGVPYNYPGYNYTSPESLNGSSTTGNGKSPFKLSPADMAALGVAGANGAASLLTLQQKMYDNEITDKSGVYNMKTELPDNFTNPTLGALRAGLQSSAQNNNWKNTSAMSSEMLSKTVTGLNSALLEQSRQNVGLFNAKQAAIYQALGVDTANKLAWNKDKTALGNYRLSAIGENLLKMASNGNTRAAENALAQMDDATLRAMLVTIGPNSKYFTEQIERIINSRKG
jgi:hypothetical protein